MKKMTNNRTFLNFLISFLFLSQLAAQNQPTVDQFMGVNLFWADPIEDAKCVGFAREFHDWRTDQNDSEFVGPSQESVVYPNECYTWNPTHSGVIDFNYFYSTLIANGMTVSPTMNNSIWPLAGYVNESSIGDTCEDEEADGDDIFCEEMMGVFSYDTSRVASRISRKPVAWSWNMSTDEWNLADPNLDIDDLNYPAPYAPRANWVYNYMAKYGCGTELDLTNSSHLKFCQDESPDLGQGMIQYVECWNEPTKDWHGAEEQFTPEQYAAMANCDYDGFDDTKPVGEKQIYILDENGNTTSVPMGIKHLYNDDELNEGKLKFVMGAPHIIVDGCLDGGNLPDCDNGPGSYSGLNLYSDCTWNVITDWIEPIQDHFNMLRPDDQFIFDVVNVHHYSSGKTDDWMEFIWFSPEDDELRLKLEWLRLEMNELGLGDKELWLSEFGYDTNDDNGAWNFPSSVINGGLSPEEIQAQWLIRSYLELAAAGVDRAVVHDLRDSGDDPFDPEALWDTHTGLLLNDGSPKKSWYYTYTMKNILTDFNYVDDLSSENCNNNRCDAVSANNCTKVYKFQNTAGETVWAVWSPTHENITPYSFPLTLSSGTTAATAISLVAPSINGVSEQLQVDDATGIVNVMVSETPVFILEEALVAPTCPSIVFDESSCTSISVEVDPGTQTINGYHIWYGETSLVSDPPNFSALNDELTYFGYDLQTNPTTENSISISGLESNTEYTIFIIPETEAGIPASISIPQPGENTCSISASTSSSIGICKIPVGDPQVVSIITNDNNDPSAENRLFDEQNDYDFCSASGPVVVEDPGAFFVNFISQSNGVQSIILEFLQEKYFMEQFHFYDGSGSGLFQFEWSNTNNGTDWAILSNYYTAPLNEWVTISNFDQPQDGIRYLRLTATTPSARLRELYICGTSVCGLDIDGITEGCSSATINVTPPLGICMTDLIVTEQSDLTGGITIPVVQSTIQIPPSPVTYGDALIPNITYYVGSNPQGDQLSFTTTDMGTDCIDGAPIIKQGVIACRTPGPSFSPRAVFYIPANIPSNYKMQFWLSSVNFMHSPTVHPLVTDINAESIIVQPGPATYVWNVGYVRPVFLIDLLGQGYIYSGAYRYITETESSILYTTYANQDPFQFKAGGCNGGGTSSSFASLVTVDCDVVGVYQGETLNTGSYEFSERTSISNTPTLGALASATIAATGEDIFYAFQDPTQIKYIYSRWTDGISPDPWEYIETDFDPCAGGTGKSDYSDVGNKQSFAKIYPNPTKSILNLICDDCLATELFSIDGRKLPLRLLKQSTNNYQFDTSQLPDGMYFIQITNNAGEREALRFVVQR